ncbi:MAG TPA: cytidine deaminase [Actinomycetes bacterium]|nr:cytidine deaminase [Actinomycetes bacterium]
MSATPDGPEVPAEDAKLLTLARSARARTGAAEGAAVRDGIGRTYAASTVSLPSLRLSALQAVVAAAVSSGSDDLDAVAVVGEAEELADHDRALLADLSVTTVLRAGPDGVPRTGR